MLQIVLVFHIYKLGKCLMLQSDCLCRCLMLQSDCLCRCLMLQTDCAGVGCSKLAVQVFGVSYCACV